MKKDNVDKRLQQILKEEMPPAPQNPWFTRKVLNRLPPRHRPGAILEKWIVLLSVLGTLVGLILEARHLIVSPEIYVRDLLMMFFYMFVFLGLAAWILIPLAKN